MGNAIRKLTIFFMLIFSVQSEISFAQGFSVSVDRREVVRGQTVTLTIKVLWKGQSIDLDLSPLTEDFDVLDNHSFNHFGSPNGVMEAWETHIVTIFPLKEGVLTIPSLTIYNEQTEPLEIVVFRASSQQLVQS